MSPEEVTHAGAATGGVRVLLRLEGAFLFAAATIAFGVAGGGPWWMFLVLFLAPDLSLAGYTLGQERGAAIYNTAHSTVGPLALATVGLLAANGTAEALGLIWAAHVGLDRALGYGLKYTAGFRFTHLGMIGRRR
jgi:hypothetical protein